MLPTTARLSHSRLSHSRRVLFGALLCGLSYAPATPSSAAGCAFESLGDGIVSTVIDPRTIRLDDGREVRLAGVETAPNESGDHRSVLTELIGRHVILRGQRDGPDRYGRQSAFVFPDGSPDSVQSELLARGRALVSTDIANRDCAAELAVAEARAREAGLGTWAHSAVIKSAESPGDILARIGQFAVVEGRVSSVREAGGTVYLNFGQRWTRDFAATIPRRMLPSFEAAGVVPKSLENRRIRVRGWVERHGGPRIAVLRTGQIEVVGDQ